MSLLSDDPRHRNQVFQGSNAGAYFDAYRKGLDEALSQVNGEVMTDIFNAISEVILKGRNLFAGGNGGSASIAEQLTCDWMKGTRAEGKRPLRAHSLCSNTALITAIANDHGYAHIFAQQLAMWSRKGDLVVLISASGNSPNIVEAAQYCQDHGLTLVGFTGFSGGKLAELAHFNLHVPVHNYGIVEDAHQAMMHSMAQFLAHYQDHR